MRARSAPIARGRRASRCRACARCSSAATSSIDLRVGVGLLRDLARGSPRRCRGRRASTVSDGSSVIGSATTHGSWLGKYVATPKSAGAPRDVERADAGLLLQLRQAVADLLQAPRRRSRRRTRRRCPGSSSSLLRQVVVVQHGDLGHLAQPLGARARAPRRTSGRRSPARRGTPAPCRSTRAGRSRGSSGRRRRLDVGDRQERRQLLRDAARADRHPHRRSAARRTSCAG